MTEETPEQLKEHQFESKGKNTTRSNSKPVGIIFDTDLLIEIDTLATEQDKSRSEIVRGILRDSLGK
jgi:hypothetical protein